MIIMHSIIPSLHEWYHHVFLPLHVYCQVQMCEYVLLGGFFSLCLASAFMFGWERKKKISTKNDHWSNLQKDLLCLESHDHNNKPQMEDDAEGTAVGIGRQKNDEHQPKKAWPVAGRHNRQVSPSTVISSSPSDPSHKVRCVWRSKRRKKKTFGILFVYFWDLGIPSLLSFDLPMTIEWKDWKIFPNFFFKCLGKKHQSRETTQHHSTRKTTKKRKREWIQKIDPFQHLLSYPILPSHSSLVVFFFFLSWSFFLSCSFFLFPVSLYPREFTSNSSFASSFRNLWSWSRDSSAVSGCGRRSAGVVVLSLASALSSSSSASSSSSRRWTSDL